MKKQLTVAIAAIVFLGAAFAQDTGGDKNKISKTTQKSVAAEKTTSTKNKAPNAQPFPTRKPADKAELNPQPLPPGKKVTASEKAALNPQPLPPGEKASSKKVSSAEKVSLNPQPLPPGASKTVTPADKAALNPQPLPPKVQKTSVKKGPAGEKSKKGSTAATAPK